VLPYKYFKQSRPDPIKIKKRKTRMRAHPLTIVAFLVVVTLAVGAPRLAAAQQRGLVYTTDIVRPGTIDSTRVYCPTAG
jgi:hypothetical protein